ncbi:MAG TPA: HAMP domain-containing sensor histidine kinase [Caulobacteraceae bacterium]|nr:HAMP domain-containing sensor histidine kinase [Caulobacteraceae bacterium]
MSDSATTREAKSGDTRAERLRRLLWPGRLSARLLILTVALVTTVGLLILFPLLSSFEERWLKDRLTAAEIGSFAFDTAVDKLISPKVAAQLRESSGVVGFAMYTDGAWVYPLPPPPVTSDSSYGIDLSSQSTTDWLAAPFRTLFSGKNKYVYVSAKPQYRRDVAFIRIVAADAPLKTELQHYLVRLLGLTILISAVAGALVYFVLTLLLVQPMQHITLAMERFRADPDDPEAHVEPSGRRDEIGRAEAELARMQVDLRAALNSRARLAALGQAVAKINHDLRNMLTSAQIASERLALSPDPMVAQAMPRLERALDRAVRLASDVLAYGKSQEPEPQKTTIALKAAIDAAGEDARLSAGGVRLRNAVKPADRLEADPEQLHRMLVNLMKNARQAIQGSAEHDGRGNVRVSYERRGADVVITVADDGPGLPARALAHLFEPFTGSGRQGGTGLGLAIARELAQAHGGDLTLIANGAAGAVFELTLPSPLPAHPREGGDSTRRRMAKNGGTSEQKNSTLKVEAVPSLGSPPSRG